MQTIARSMADTGPIEGRYMPHAPPIVGRYGKRPHSRMRLQLRTVHDLIGSPRAPLRAAPIETAHSRMRLQLRTVHDLIGSPRAPLRAAPMETAQHVVRLWHARAGRLRCVAADGLGHYSVLEAAIIIDPLPICLALSVGRTGLRHRLAIDCRLRSHRLQVVGRAR